MKCKHPFTGPHTTMTYSCHLYHSSSFTTSSIWDHSHSASHCYIGLHHTVYFISVSDKWPLLQSA